MNDSSSEPAFETSNVNTLTTDEKNMATLCHLVTLANMATALLGTIACLVLWIVKKDESEFIDYNGKQALNFQITLIIGYIICIPFICAFYLGLLMMTVLYFVNIIFTILAALDASAGKRYKYPMTIQFF